MAALREAFGAAFSGNFSNFKKSANKLDNLDVRDSERGTTLMYTAARFGHLSVVKWLVERGASINKKNTAEGSSSTPLHGACFGGHHSIVDYLCKLGPKMQENEYGDTPLGDAQSPHDDVSDSDKKKCVSTIKSRIKEIAAEQEESDSENSKPTKGKKQSKKPERKDEEINKQPTTPKPTKPVKKKEPSAEPSSEEKPKPKSKNKKPAASPKKKAKPDNDDIEELRNAKAVLDKIDKDCEEFWDLENKFNGCLQGRNEDYVATRLKKGKKPLTFIVKEIRKIRNPVLEKRYKAFLSKMKEKYPNEKDKWRERASFHGSAKKNIQSIANTSLLRFKHPLNPCKSQSDDGWFGTNKKGVYVSRYAEYTFKYANGGEPLEDGDSCEVLMFKTLPGKSHRIAEVNLGMNPTPGYESHSSPTYLEWYLFDEAQLCPEYVHLLFSIVNSVIIVIILFMKKNKKNSYVLKVVAKEDTRTAADDGD